MSDKRRNSKYESYQNLTSAGVNVQKEDQIRPNPGSETFRHEVAKLAVAHIGKANDYWVSSEVEMMNGRADIVLWGNPERLTYVVELETGWTEDTKSEKLQQYVLDQPGIDDMLTVEVTDLPGDTMDILDNVSNQIGLEP